MEVSEIEQKKISIKWLSLADENEYSLKYFNILLSSKNSIEKIIEFNDSTSPANRSDLFKKKIINFFNFKIGILDRLKLMIFILETFTIFHFHQF